MLYQYKAKSLGGDMISGVIEANSTFAAQQDLRRRGQLLLSISQNSTGTFAGARRKLKRTGKVPRTELLILTSQLAIMCETGVDLAEAFEESARQATHPVLRKALVQIHRDVSDGKPISTAMAAQADVFGMTYVASFAAGESSGRMEDVLNRLSDILEGEIRLRSMLKTVLAYPVVLMCLSVLTLGVLLFFVLPHFGEIFDGMNVPLPASTEILLSLSDSLTESPAIWGLSALAGMAAVLFGFRSTAVRTEIDYLTLHAKGISEITRSLMVGRAFRLCGTMVQSGVPLLEAIQMTRRSVSNSVFRKLFDQLEAEVLNGRGIGTALTTSRFIPRGAARMVVTAERTGQLGRVMDRVGTFYESEGERRLQEFSKLLEPAIIISMGCVVATVVLSILLPMFTLTQMAGMRG
ncbi:MAG: type II secretion system F family protein [Fuerstiella sp.]